ncbi:MarR family winged helix-turn-helix transcriptional regulator, partial [Streptomyces zhihengii]
MSDETAGATPGFLVWRLSMKWRVAVDRALAPLGLTHAQYSVVATLRGLDRSGIRPSQRELADHTGLEALYVSKLARSLEAAGSSFARLSCTLRSDWCRAAPGARFCVGLATQAP